MVVHASRRTTPTAARSRSSPARSGWSGSASCSPGSSGAAQLLAAEGLFAAERKRPLPFLPGTRRPGHRARARPPSATCSRTPGAAGRRSRFRGRARRRCRARRAAAEVIEALAPPRPRPRGRRHRGRPRRRLGRGPAAVLRRGADPRGRTRAAPRSSRAIGHEPDTPLLDLVADVRASTPTDAAKLVVPDVAEELAPGRARRATGSAQLRRPAGWPASRHGLDALRARPGARRPAQPARRPRATRSTRCATAPAAPCDHRLDRAADDLGHQLARVAALSPLATLQRGYAVLQDADGHVVTSVGRRRAPARALQRPGGRRPDRTPPSPAPSPTELTAPSTRSTP